MVKGMRRTILPALTFFVCAHAEAQLIKGNIPESDKLKWADINYSRDFDFFKSKIQKINFSPNGDFSWDTQLPNRYGIVSIETYDGSVEVVVEQGECMEISTQSDKNGKRHLCYNGKNKSATDYLRALEHKTSITAITGYGNPEERVSKEEGLRILDEVIADMRKQLKKVKPKAAREFMARYTDMLYTHYRLEIISQHQDTHFRAQFPDEEYQKVVAAVNPDDPVNLTWQLPHKWVYNQIDPALANKDDLTDYALRYLEVMKPAITNPQVKHQLLDNLIDHVVASGNPQDVDRFWNPIAEYAADDAELMEKYKPMIEALRNTRAGKMAPEQTFCDADGKQFRLSDFRGKVLYIDVWATWCVPCKQEIPHFAKVAEHYKDNPGIQLISISIDKESDHDKWRKMIAEEKPQWPQFVTSDAEDKKLSTDFNIKFIPRFIIINADGTIQNADAPRPSDKDIINYLDELLN